MGHTLTVRQVAERLQLHERTVYRLLKSRELPGRRVGSQWRIPVDAFEAYLRGEGPNRSELSAGAAAKGEGAPHVAER